MAISGCDPYKPIAQLPPTWSSWVDVLKILIKNGASVHNTIDGRPLGALNLVRPDLDSHLLQFFQLLKSEYYQDFNIIQGRVGWSAVYNAVRAKDQSLETLRLLKLSGVNFTTIMNDGRVPLHQVAQLADNAEALEFVYNEKPSFIDRQDNHGWTPLHYCIIQEAYRGDPQSFCKIRFLISRGADPFLRSFSVPPVFQIRLDVPLCCTPLELAENLRPSLFNDIIQVMRQQGLIIPPNNDEDVFEDANEIP